MFDHRKSVQRGVVVALLVPAAIHAGCARDTSDEKQPAIGAARGEVDVMDGRTPIVVTAATRYAVLAEMRTMLNAVQGVIGGAAQRDTAMMRAAATSAGVAAASESDDEAAAQLGPDFVQLGMRTHTSFDSLAMDISQGKNESVVLRRLATAMGNCVGCHDKFRLVVQATAQ